MRFLGQVADAPSVVAASDVLVLPSHSEGMPAVLIEAGFSGIPVVATEVGAVSSIVRDGETGFLVQRTDDVHIFTDQLVDVLRRALGSPDDVGLAARAHCLEHFEIEVVADRWDALLAELGAWDAA